MPHDTSNNDGSSYIPVVTGTVETPQTATVVTATTTNSSNNNGNNSLKSPLLDNYEKGEEKFQRLDPKDIRAPVLLYPGKNSVSHTAVNLMHGRFAKPHEDREVSTCLLCFFLILRRYNFEYHNNSGAKQDCLFVLPSEGTVTNFEAFLDGGRVIDTTVVATRDFAKMKRRKNIGNQSAIQKLASPFENYFRVPVNGIKPGQKVSVVVEVIETLEFRNFRYNLELNTTFPTEAIPSVTSVQFVVHSLVPELTYASSTHQIALAEQRVSKELGAEQEGRAPETAWDQRNSFCLFLSPSVTSAQTFPRDVIFLVDRSSSMSGKPFQKALEALGAAFGTLNPSDYAAVVAFDHEFNSTELMQATPQNLQKLMGFLQQNGPRGGTNIQKPLLWALDTLNTAAALQAPQRQALRSVVLITDGCVSNERQIVREARTLVDSKNGTMTRIHTIGLGPYCNHQFLKMLARYGRGFNTNVIDMEAMGSPVRVKTMKLMHSVAVPVLTNIVLEMPANGCELYPYPIPDLFSGKPVCVSGRYEGVLPASIVVQGLLPNGTVFRQEVKKSTSDLIPVGRVYAKGCIDDLTARYWLWEDAKLMEQVIQLSVAENMPSAYTTVVAFETTAKKKQQEKKKRGKSSAARKKPSMSKGAMVGTLAVGGVLAIGAGVFLMGGAGAQAATTANALPTIAHAGAHIAQFGGHVVGKAGSALTRAGHSIGHVGGGDGICGSCCSLNCCHGNCCNDGCNPCSSIGLCLHEGMDCFCSLADIADCFKCCDAGCLIQCLSGLLKAI
eukprot:jgi/Bigna1/66825/fgenesh1_pg.2_\